MSHLLKGLTPLLFIPNPVVLVGLIQQGKLLSWEEVTNCLLNWGDVPAEDSQSEGRNGALLTLCEP